MSKLFFVFFSFYSLVGFSESGKISGLMMETQIISNEFNKDVRPGTFAVKGNVRLMYGNTPISNAIITNSKESISVSTDSAGFFQLFFPITDTSIFCYKIGLNEIKLQGPFKSQHLIEVNFYLQDPKIPVVCTKPVIYVYNAPNEFGLSLIPHGGFSFTYPKYENGWQLKTNTEGTLTDLSTGKNYPYLFWEGPGKDLDFISTKNNLEGYLIKTDTCISFFENILAQYGLNEREATDFITWWGPQLVKKDYALIQFLSNDLYSEKIAEISLTKKPDALLRLYMYVMPLDSPETNYTIVQPKIDSFNLSGFTIVEWGGSVIPQSQIVN